MKPNWSTVFACGLAVMLGASSTADAQQRPGTIHLEQVVAEIGTEIGNPEQGVRHIQQLAVDRQHNLYLLDSELGQVAAFSPAGHYLFSTGRPGRGIGEFRLPQSLTLDEGNRLYVYDIAAQDITQYRVQPKRLTFVKTEHVALAGSSICAMDDRVYLFGLNSKKILHQLSTDGRLVRSFGEPFGTYNSLAEESLAAGQVVCVAQLKLVIVVPNIYPEVRAYSSEGRLIWTTRLNRYRHTRIQENRDGSVTFTRPPGGVHMAVSMFVLNASTVCVQLGLSEDRNRLQEVETRFISTGTGEQLTVQPDLPVLSSPRPPFIYAVSNDSGPHVTIYRFHFSQESAR